MRRCVQTADAIFKLSLEDAGVLTICDIFTLLDDDDVYDEVSLRIHNLNMLIIAQQYDTLNASILTTPNSFGAPAGLSASAKSSLGLADYFRQSSEACQLILKAEPLRETLQGCNIFFSNESNLVVLTFIHQS
jgi:hypothetical protein